MKDSSNATISKHVLRARSGPFEAANPTDSPTAVRRVGLLNHMGGGNLGDDGTETAIIQQIRRRWPHAEISLFSMNPADTHARHGVPSYPIRSETWMHHEQPRYNSSAVASKVKDRLRKYSTLFHLLRMIHVATITLPRTILNETYFLTKSFRILRPFDLFLIGGGGQLLDSWGGPWKFPYTLFKWTFLAKLSRVKCYFLNVGAGPLAHPLAKWFVKRALGVADYISFRDHESKALVHMAGFRGRSSVIADCAYALECPSPRVRNQSKGEGLTVGFSPMAYCDPRIYWQKDAEVYERFIRLAASFGLWLGQKRYNVRLFSTDIWFDFPTMEEVKTRLANADGHGQMVTLERIVDFEQLLSAMHAMDYIVTCRFHGVVFANLLNKPVLALSHHPKVSALMSDMGLTRYCVDIDQCDVNMLQETFLSLVENERQIRACMADRVAYYKRALLRQFDLLFPQGVTI